MSRHETHEEAALSLPERYADPKQKLVRARSIRAIAQYVRLLRGNAYTESRFRALGTQQAQFAEQDGFASPLFADDLLTSLAHDGFTDFQIRQMGSTTLLTNHRSRLASVLSKPVSPRQLYEDLHEQHLHHYDQIWTYRLLHIDAKGCIAEARPRESVSELFKTKHVGSRRMCLFREGVYAAVLGHISSRLAKTAETECVFLGDSRCLYHMSWD
ncbi:MAG: hypothetical protein HY075_02310 [Deltaproteobacteria bacterium]|nr:hypothetical protein [Deltaproteobacteria bacterium]